jgi:hypothetical protein
MRRGENCSPPLEGDHVATDAQRRTRESILRRKALRDGSEAGGALASAPADPVAYEKACLAAGGDEVREVHAAAVLPGMTIWHGSRWLAVQYRRMSGAAVMFDFAVPEPGSTAYRMLDPHMPMLRRITAKESGR